MRSTVRSAFCRASVKQRPMDIASPTDFIVVVRVESAAGNFSKANRGTLTTTYSRVGSKLAGVSRVMSLRTSFRV